MSYFFLCRNSSFIEMRRIIGRELFAVSVSKNFEIIDLITYVYQYLKVQLTFKQHGFGYTRISFSINIV